ncbi:YcgN family cysteine cluster protein [Cellvibrio sp. QJXJ]|uniref:YcgN family cysteine cluster protein n=1 Tax=Cellvibrio sp. QJXJ TaxID=2964606 RepID=UPI0021C3EE3F|nr:YcgN family cysteine cluster protein [Cellvibrio sp. QJXJ]UUA73356.1 YcgN family cysteine cluster protein [Cellvibrio sp. QJXJ]
MAQQVFWQRKTFQEMSPEEFESLCDGCGKCCLHKLEDEDSGDVYYTKVACRYLDHDTCRCQEYTDRQQLVEACAVLTPDSVKETYWLPETCAYRLVADGFPLFDWHPLVSGDPDSVHKAGISVAGRVVHEQDVDPEDYEDYVIRWVN